MSNKLILSLALIIATGCSDDTTTPDGATNNTQTNQSNNATTTNNKTTNTNGETNDSLGTWTVDVDGTPYEGTAVQPYYSEANDLLTIALQGGPDGFNTLSIEITGEKYGATGTFSAATHDMRVTAGGTGFTCFSGDDSTFAVTFEEISCSSISVCSAKGTFTGTLDCNAAGVVQLDGSFER